MTVEQAAACSSIDLVQQPAVSSLLDEDTKTSKSFGSARLSIF